MTERPVVRMATERDVRPVAALFRQCMSDVPENVWARLGPAACEIYFRHHVESAYELMVVAEAAGDVVGACLGTGRPGTWMRALYVEQAHGLASALLLGIWRHPGVTVLLGRRLTRRASRLLRRRQRGARPEAPSPTMDTCYMSLFFVAASWRGHQIGSRMLAMFADEMARRGYRLCTVQTTIGNVSSQRAQQRAGFSEVARHGQQVTYARALAAPE